MDSKDPLPRARLIEPVFRTIVAVVPIGLGVLMASRGSAGLGLVLIVTGAITTVLAIRLVIRARRASGGEFEASGRLPDAQFDYIVWTALAVPVLVVIALLVFVVAGGR